MILPATTSAPKAGKITARRPVEAGDQAAPAQEEIVAGAAPDHVRSRTAVDDIVARASGEIIVAGAALQRIGLVPAGQLVGSLRGQQDVAPCVAVELLVTDAIGEVIMAGAAVTFSVPVRERDAVVALVAEDLLTLGGAP